MTDAVEVAIIAAIPATIAALLGFINSAAIRRQERHIASAKADIASTKVAVVTLEKHTNSITEALVKVTGESEYAKGKLEGAADAKACQS